MPVIILNQSSDFNSPLIIVTFLDSGVRGLALMFPVLLDWPLVSVGFGGGTLQNPSRQHGSHPVAHAHIKITLQLLGFLVPGNSESGWPVIFRRKLKLWPVLVKLVKIFFHFLASPAYPYELSAHPPVFANVLPQYELPVSDFQLFSMYQTNPSQLPTYPCHERGWSAVIGILIRASNLPS